MSVVSQWEVRFTSCLLTCIAYGNAIFSTSRSTQARSTMHTEVTKKRFTVEEYYKIDEAGILSPEVRTELIDGEIIEVTTMGARHASVLSRVTRLFVELFNGKAILRAQLPFPISEFTQVQPDAALFKPSIDYYGSAHPGPGDVLLVLEIADSSLKYDRDMKLKVYAAANVPEVWIA